MKRTDRQLDERQAITARAYKYLSYRDYSTAELTAKLTADKHPLELIDRVIQQCLDDGYLDDNRYTINKIQSLAVKGYGQLQILMRLQQRGIGQSVINKLLNEADIDWFSLAQKVQRKKYNQLPPNDSKEYAKQARFLKYRGFSTKEIYYALDTKK